MTECVGFADCPCPRCRETRATTTYEHPDHPRTRAPYCGVCRTEDRQKHSTR